jgi:hypothetical protein
MEHSSRELNKHPVRSRVKTGSGILPVKQIVRTNIKVKLIFFSNFIGVFPDKSVEFFTQRLISSESYVCHGIM